MADTPSQTGVYRESSNISAFGAAALKYASEGKPVFPTRPGTKKPLRHSRGFYDATTDPEIIRRWWHEAPDANVAFPTGKRSGIISLDDDIYKPGAWSREDIERELGPLPDTFTIKTGRDGRQYYYGLPEGLKDDLRNGIPEGELGPGLCIKADGGYVVAPPSVTESPYEVIENRPIGEAPEWMIAALKGPRKAARDHENDTDAYSQRLRTDTGKGQIPDGMRNVTLAFIAGRLHDGTRSLPQLTADLMEVNKTRCKPPLPDSEVRGIAVSIHRRDPAKPTREVAPETLETLERIGEVHLWGRMWKGNGWNTARSLLVVLLDEAARHGEMRTEGVFISLSIRAAALRVGVDEKTIRRKDGARDKLIEAGVIKKARGYRCGGFILLHPEGVGKYPHSSSWCGVVASTAGIFPRLRYSKGVYTTLDGVAVWSGTVKRLGKSGEKIVDLLLRHDTWMSVPDLGGAMGLKHHRDLRRSGGVLDRLTKAEVIEWFGDSVRLTSDWLKALNSRRETDEEIEDYERDKARYARERKEYQDMTQCRNLYRVGAEIEVIAAELDISIVDVCRYLNIPHAAPNPPEEREPELQPVEVETSGLRYIITRDVPRRLKAPPGWTIITFEREPDPNEEPCMHSDPLFGTYPGGVGCYICDERHPLRFHVYLPEESLVAA